MLRLTPASLPSIVLSAAIAAPAAAQCSWEWQRGLGFPGVNGPTWTITEWDPDGPGPAPRRLVFGGNFTAAGNVPANRIASWDGEQWHTFGAGFNRDVYSLASYNGDLYAAGRFSKSGDADIPAVVRWRNGRWEPFGNFSFTEVRAISAWNDLLYVGGFLLWTWDGTSRRQIGPDSGGYNWAPDAMAPHADRLYVIRKLQGFDGHDLVSISRQDEIRHEGYWSIPRGLASLGGSLYLSGGHYINNYLNGYVYRHEGTLLGPLFNNYVHALAPFRGALHATGAFTAAVYRPLRSIVRWENDRWEQVGDGLEGSGFALHVFNDTLIVAGNFTRAGARPARSVAAWNGADFSPICRGIDAPVRAALPWKDGFVVAGDFSAIDGVDASRVALWHEGKVHPLGTGLPDRVNSLCRHLGLLVAGGNFSGPAGAHVSAWNG